MFFRTYTVTQENMQKIDDDFLNVFISIRF